MSKASDRAVARVDALNLGIANDCGVVDAIADLLNWAEDKGIIAPQPPEDGDLTWEDYQNAADDILQSALRHYDAERGEGDDLANVN